MNFSYDGVALDELGDVEVQQKFEFEGGDAPQRAKATLNVTVYLFERDFSANNSLVQQARTALRKQNAIARWTNDVTQEDYLNQTVTNVSHDLPEAWGEYHQVLHLVFTYHEHNLNPQNLPLLFKRTGSNTSLTLSHVSSFKESGSSERFSSLRSARKETQNKVSISGYVLADPKRTLAQRRADLTAALTLYREQMNGAEGLMQFGNAPTFVLNATVKVENFTSEFDQGVYQLNYSFDASYTLFPTGAEYAQVEFNVDEKDALTGELFLSLTGKIRAATEAIARTKAAAVLTAILTQYGYAVSQQQRWDTNASKVDASTDGEAFIELSFTGEARRWRDTNQQLTFKKQGSTGAAIGFGNVRTLNKSYTAKRFNEQRSQRESAGGQLEASGTWAADRTLSAAQKRTALNAMVDAMYAEVNKADGQLVYGATFDKVVRVDNLKAEINQAETGIDWSFQATWSEFPNEANYATTDFTVNQRDNVEDGDDQLLFAGKVRAQNGEAARAKLTMLRASVLGIYGYQERQRVRGETSAAGIDANGDKTAGIAEGLETATTDGVSFIELTFSEEYRKRNASVLSHTLQRQSREDITTGLITTTYSGTVIAGGADATTAYDTARAEAELLGRNKESLIGGNAFLKTATIGDDQRQTSTLNNVEHVRLSFSYEYQSKLGTGRRYLEVTVQVVRDTFGQDVENVSGYCVALDHATAEQFYFDEVRDGYSLRLIRNESTGTSSLTAEKSGAFTDQELRFEFSFQVFRVKSGPIAFRYSINVRRDFLNGEKQTHVRGSVFAINADAAEMALDAFLLTLGLGQPTNDDRTHDHEYVDQGPTDADYPGLFGKLDFDASYTGSLTGVSGLYEMKVTVETQYSGTRWAAQPIPFSADPPTLWNPNDPPADIGGVTIVQPTGLQEGSRVIRGTVSASSMTLAEDWAKLHRVPSTDLLFANGYYPQPEKWDRDYELVPRTQGLITGANPDVKIYRVSFTFGYILPKYAPPA